MSPRVSTNRVITEILYRRLVPVSNDIHFSILNALSCSGCKILIALSKIQDLWF